MVIRSSSSDLRLLLMSLIWKNVQATIFRQISASTYSRDDNAGMIERCSLPIAMSDDGVFEN
jgi:hypothetical protein